MYNENRSLGDDINNTSSGMLDAGQTGLDAYRIAKNTSRGGQAAPSSGVGGIAGKSAESAAAASAAAGTGAGSAGGAAAATASAGGPLGVAIGALMMAANSKPGRYIIGGILTFLLLIIALPFMTPSIVWNEITQLDPEAKSFFRDVESNMKTGDAYIPYLESTTISSKTNKDGEVKTPVTIDQEDMVEAENKWAEIIYEAMEDGLYKAVDTVKEELKENDEVDYERSIANIIIANADFDLSEDRGSQLENEARDQIKEYISSLKGLEYKEGGRDFQTGVDEIGFIIAIYDKFDADIDASSLKDLYSNLQESTVIKGEKLGNKVLKSEYRKIEIGDVIIFGQKNAESIGIYIGDDEYIYMDENGLHTEKLYIESEEKQEEKSEEQTENEKIDSGSDEEGKNEGDKAADEDVEIELTKEILGAYSPLTDDDLVNIAIYGEVETESGSMITTSSQTAVEGVDAISEYEPYVYAFLREHGYSHAVACGFLGNMRVESHVTPSSVEGDYAFSENIVKIAATDMNSYVKNYLFPLYDRDGLGINKDGYYYDGKYYCGCGLIQWTGVRTVKLMNLAKEKGMNWTELELQLQLMENELSNGYSSLSTAAFKAETDVDAAAYKVAVVYEGTTYKMSQRISYAKDAYKRYNGVDIQAIGKWKSTSAPSISITSRTIAQIIAALSVKEEQYLGGYGKATNEDNIIKKFIASITSIFHTPEKTLKNAIKKNKEYLYEVTYGDIVEKEVQTSSGTETVKYYSSIKITPTISGEVSAKLFDLDPEAPYITDRESDNFYIGSSDMKIKDGIEMLADTHMELLYDNHDLGSGQLYGVSGVYGPKGSGSLGLPVPTNIGPVAGNLFGVRNTYRYVAGASGTINNIHKGIDFAAPMQTPIYAVEDGYVSQVVPESMGWGAGNYIRIKHDNGLDSEYMHLNSFLVKQGDRVSKGQQIAYSGQSGIGSGPHLHFGVYLDGINVNPLPYLYTGDILAKYQAMEREQWGQTDWPTWTPEVWYKANGVNPD